MHIAGLPVRSYPASVGRRLMRQLLSTLVVAVAATAFLVMVLVRAESLTAPPHCESTLDWLCLSV